MQGYDYIFCLQDKNNNFYQPDSSGLVTISSNPYLLKFSPDGWEDISIQNIRNKKYWGVDRSVTVPLSYVNDGALILKDIFYRNGIEETVYLTICKLELDYTAGVSYGYWYKQIYKGEVDLSTFVHNGAKVTCTTLEDGLPKYLKANENTVLEIPMNVTDAIYVKMDGINLHNSVETFVTNGLDQPDNFNNHIIAQEIIIEDAPYVNGKKSVERIKVGNVNTDIRATGGWFAKPNIDCVFSLEWDFIVTLNFIPPPGANPAAVFKIVVRAIDETNISTNQIELLSVTYTGFNATYHVIGSSSITVDANDELYLYAFCNVQGATGDSQLDVTYDITGDSVFKYTYLYRSPTTYIKALRPQYIFTYLIDKVTEGNYSAEVSSYFETWKHIVFTCGNAIRGLEDAVMKISLADFFQFWDCFDAVGMSEKSKRVNFDSKENLVDKLNYIELENPSDLKVTTAKDYLFNELEIGYPEIKNEVGVLNGNEEFNCKYSFSVGTTKAPAKLEKVSKIKASCYEIEKIRVTTLLKDTTDYKADNDNFVLAIDDTLQPVDGDILEHYELDRSLNAGTTGLIEPNTVFNIPLSPKRMFLRNSSFLKSCLSRSGNKTLYYKSSDKNNKMVSDSIIEKSDVTYSELNDNFFTTVLFDFEVPAPNDLINLLDLNPLQVFQFNYDGETYQGILVKVSIAPSTRKAQTYQLLSVSENVLIKLIDYYG